jgi:hypothetical protein
MRRVQYRSSLTCPPWRVTRHLLALRSLECDEGPLITRRFSLATRYSFGDSSSWSVWRSGFTDPSDFGFRSFALAFFAFLAGMDFLLFQLMSKRGFPRWGLRNDQWAPYTPRIAARKLERSKISLHTLCDAIRPGRSLRGQRRAGRRAVRRAARRVRFRRLIVPRHFGEPQWHGSRRARHLKR